MIITSYVPKNGLQVNVRWKVTPKKPFYLMDSVASFMQARGVDIDAIVVADNWPGFPEEQLFKAPIYR